MTGKRWHPHNNKRQYKKAKFHDGGASKLEVGMHGVLVSHDRNKERFCQLDTFQLLNHFADILYGPEKLPSQENAQDDSDDNDDDDIENALSNEVKEIKENSCKKAQRNRRFTAVKSGCNNLIFIRFEDGISPSTLLNDIVANISTADSTEKSFPRVRNVLRVHPVEFTCSAFLDSMQKSIPEFLKTKFDEIEDSVDTKEYNVTYKCRNNTHLDKEAVKTDLYKDIQTSLQGWKFNCRTDSVLIIIDVVRTVCLVSVVKDFLKCKRYNIRELLAQSAKSVISSECEKTDSPPACSSGQHNVESNDNCEPTINECEGSDQVTEQEPAPAKVDNE